MDHICPEYLRYLNGNARATSIVVNTSGADYVFGKDYMLSPLKELDEFIKEHHHLLGIAPAEEMQKKGMDLGDNQVRLLAKIEELTLYVIEQQKQMETLNGQMMILKDQLSRINKNNPIK